jgi:histidinol-phosphate aminotransferase
MLTGMSASPTVEEFWAEVRTALPGLPEAVPEAWAFGATPDHADGLLALVLEGTKTATASSLWDLEHTGDPVPGVGELSIILDGRGVPRALLETTAVEVVAFDEVSESHAFAEGEGDRSLAQWREVHEHYWRAYSASPRGFESRMPIVCERLKLRYAEGRAASTARP